MKLNLTDSQIKKLVKGGACQLTHSQIKGSGKGMLVDIALHPMTLKALKKAIKGNKGSRLMMSPQEIEGSGLLDLLKKGAKVVKKGSKKAFEFYKDELKEDLGPLIKKGIKENVSKAIDASPLSGDAKDALKKSSGKIVDKIGKSTGAFGLNQMIGYGMTDCGMVPIFDLRSEFARQPAMRPMVYRGFGAVDSANDPFLDGTTGAGFKALGSGFSSLG